MKPDRSNYELWIIDWLDGKLDRQGIDMLMCFLEANPDLKEEVDSISSSLLITSDAYFNGKEKLKKSASDITTSQIEFLSAAYLENDLTPGQLDDLEQNISGNAEHRQIFNAIQKTRLEAPAVLYNNKKNLKKRTIGEKVLRLSLIGLSSAATIALLIASYALVSGYFSEKNNIQVQPVISGNYSGEPFEIASRKLREPDERPALSTIIPERITVAPIQETSVPLTDSLIRVPGSPEYNISRVTTSFTSFIPADNKPVSLIATGLSKPVLIPIDDERSKFSKFLARNFREKILKEGAGNEAPVKSYEIAEAGIEGLNKLMGWEMALVRTSDDDGELKSVYFSSRILKFNAPVKKTEPAL